MVSDPGGRRLGTADGDPGLSPLALCLRLSFFGELAFIPLRAILLLKGVTWGCPPGHPAIVRGLAFVGVTMATFASRFFSVPARFDGAVVCRQHRQSRSVWAWRLPRAGQLLSAPCLFVPLASRSTATRLARAALGLGWRAWVKPGAACAVYQSGPLSAQVPPFVAKVELPVGISAAAARAALGQAYRAAPTA